MRCICWSLFALTLLSCNGPRQTSVSPPSDPPCLEQELEAIRTKHGLPGLAAVVVRGGQVVSSAVAGVRRMSTGDRLRIDDRFHIASCTKSMTATLAAIVVEEGGLQWTSRLAGVLPELRSARREYQDATLEQLPVVLWPAGAVHGSIGDLGHYTADHLNGLLGRKALLPQSAYEKLHRTPDGADQGFTLGWGVRRDERWGVLHYDSGSGGTFFVRIAIAPEHDVAVAVASNSGEAAAATREAVESLLAQPGPDGVK